MSLHKMYGADISKLLKRAGFVVRRDGLLSSTLMTAVALDRKWRQHRRPDQSRQAEQIYTAALSRLKPEQEYVEIRVHEGSRMLVFRDDHGISKDLIVYGKRESPAMAALAPYLYGRKMIFDVGANIGYYVLFYQAYGSPENRIFAFEPSPKNFHLLEENVRINGFHESTRCYPVAISDRNGLAELTLENHSNWNHLDHFASYANLQGSKTIEVQVTTLDAFCERKHIAEIDLLRADIEGHEHALLCGAMNVLRRSKKCCLFIEFHTYLIEQAGHDPVETLGLIEDAGFQCRVITGVAGRKMENVDWTSLKGYFRPIIGYYGTHFIFEK